ncbi:universal stress protein [Catenulispora subtropica]|uniref:Universal stress protein n=1 Tax=Catenulispora subtropica TaxID=450798 RepID=A0ABP5E0E9_9ACTN
MKSTVVVGYDQTPHSERALVQAAREAAWRGGSLTVVHAFDWISSTAPKTYVPAGVGATLERSAEHIAGHGADLARSRFPGLHVDAAVVPGDAAEALTTAARGADLLVVGNRGRGGFTGLLLGSVSMRALTQSCVPTMVVRGEPRDPHDVVLVAVDVEEPSDEVLDFAFAEASRRGARVAAVYAWDMTWTAEYAEYIGNVADVRQATAAAAADLDAALEAVVRTWHAKYPDVHVSHRVAHGAPAAVLTEATHHADLIVAGARHHGDGRHGMRVGPVAHALGHHAECPVVLVPHG